VREAKGEGAAQLIDHLKKGDMAVEAERLLKGSGWLPEVLRRADLVALQDETSDGHGDDIADEAGIAPEEADMSLDTVDLPAFLVADLSADPAQMIAAE
jgi:ParB family chromosome partitioning protein